MALLAKHVSPVAKLIIAILLMQLFHSAEAGTLECNAWVASGCASTVPKNPCPRKLLKDIHGRYLMQWQSPTNPGHSPSIGHGIPHKIWIWYYSVLVKMLHEPVCSCCTRMWCIAIESNLFPIIKLHADLLLVICVASHVLTSCFLHCVCASVVTWA